MEHDGSCDHVTSKRLVTNNIRYWWERGRYTVRSLNAIVRLHLHRAWWYLARFFLVLQASTMGTITDQFLTFLSSIRGQTDKNCLRGCGRTVIFSANEISCILLLTNERARKVIDNHFVRLNKIQFFLHFHPTIPFLSRPCPLDHFSLL